MVGVVATKEAAAAPAAASAAAWPARAAWSRAEPAAASPSIPSRAGCMAPPAACATAAAEEPAPFGGALRASDDTDVVGDSGGVAIDDDVAELTEGLSATGKEPKAPVAVPATPGGDGAGKGSQPGVDAAAAASPRPAETGSSLPSSTWAPSHSAPPGASFSSDTAGAAGAGAAAAAAAARRSAGSGAAWPAAAHPAPTPLPAEGGGSSGSSDMVSSNGSGVAAAGAGAGATRAASGGMSSFGRAPPPAVELSPRPLLLLSGPDPSVNSSHGGTTPAVKPASDGDVTGGTVWPPAPAPELPAPKLPPQLPLLLLLSCCCCCCCAPWLSV